MSLNISSILMLWISGKPLLTLFYRCLRSVFLCGKLTAAHKIAGAVRDTISRVYCCGKSAVQPVQKNTPSPHKMLFALNDFTSLNL